jgi:hypothetical protein
LHDASLTTEALSITEQTFGKNHSNSGRIINFLANTYTNEGANEQAEVLFKLSLSIARASGNGSDPAN